MANPLGDIGPSKEKRVTTKMLEDMAASLNKEPFVKGMGRHYRVGREPIEGGGVRHFLTWESVR